MYDSRMKKEERILALRALAKKHPHGEKSIKSKKYGNTVVYSRFKAISSISNRISINGSKVHK